MTKVKIQTNRDYERDIPPVVLYEAPMNMPIPRVGETVNVWSGWCCETVKDINYCIERKEVLITLDTLPSADYFIEAVRQGVVQYKRASEYFRYTEELED